MLLITDLAQIEALDAADLIRWAVEKYRSHFAIVTSFQREGMVVLDIASKISSDIRVVTLDTGRLPEATHEVIELVRSRFGLRVETVAPDPSEIEIMATRYGPNLFYENLPYRNLCCHIRKVRPLQRKLKQFEAYAVGLRRGQSDSRETLRSVVQDGDRLKLSPLAQWTKADVEEYTRKHDLPEHPLYRQGYTSIGCAPCTRPTAPGESERAGRWWWELDTRKECGIHYAPDGRVQRALDVLVEEIVQAAHA